MLKIFLTVGGSKRSSRKSTFHNLEPGNKRSATEKFEKSTKFTLGLGLKLGIDGIQGESQILIFEPSEIDQQAHFSTTFLFIISPFQIQDAEGLEGASKKEMPCFKYLPLKALTQSKGSFESIFQPKRARRELLINSMEQMPRPPKVLG
jgi:hypothetical protein